MEKPEIVSGIRTAIERGYSLEQAKSSFINAGYSQQDIDDSSREFTSFATSNQSLSPIMPTPSALPSNKIQNPLIPAQTQTQAPTQAPKTPEIPNFSQPSQTPEKKSNKMTILVIILVVVLTLLILGLIATIFFKEQLLSLFQ